MSSEWVDPNFHIRCDAIKSFDEKQKIHLGSWNGRLQASYEIKEARTGRELRTGDELSLRTAFKRLTD